MFDIHVIYMSIYQNVNLGHCFDFFYIIKFNRICCAPFPWIEYEDEIWTSLNFASIKIWNKLKVYQPQIDLTSNWFNLW